MKDTEEEEIMSMQDKKEFINDDHEDKEEDDQNEAQVTSLLHHILVEYISKYALFHICRKCDFNNEFFKICRFLLCQVMPKFLLNFYNILNHLFHFICFISDDPG